MRGLPIILLAALVVEGCGGGGSSTTTTTPAGRSIPAARAAAQAYVDAYTARDPKAICRVLIPPVRKQLADNKGTCVKTVRFSIRGQKFPHVTIKAATGDRGTATATIAGSVRQIKLQNVAGAWKVSDGGT